MRTIAHLSDLHFGRTDEAVLPALIDTIREAKPDVVVVSGDLTQRARRREFRAARDFLSMLAFSQVIVPGNHDVPLYNVYMRAFHPLSRFRRFFGEEVAPFLADDEIAIIGVNTARSLTFKDGRINREQVADVCRRLRPLGVRVTNRREPPPFPRDRRSPRRWFGGTGDHGDGGLRPVPDRPRPVWSSPLRPILAGRGALCQRRIFCFAGASRHRDLNAPPWRTQLVQHRFW